MNFLYGTYGIDILSLFLLVLSMLFNISSHTRIISLVLMILAIFRAFSKNTYKRSAELSKFITFVNSILRRFGKSLPYNLPKVSLESYPLLFKQLKYKLNQKIKFKIVQCPNCKQKLRLPRGQKSIIVTCKRCSYEFKMKT